MKSFLTPLIFLITVLSARAQYTVDSRELMVPYETRCPVLFPADTVQTMAFFKGNLTRYFTKHVNWKMLEQIEGIIVLRVLVDTNGKACVYSITNNTSSPDDKIMNLFFGDLVAAMKWRPAMVNNKPVNSMRGIALYNRVENEQDFAVGYFNLARKFKMYQPKKKIKRTFSDNAPGNGFEKKEVIRKKEN